MTEWIGMEGLDQDVNLNLKENSNKAEEILEQGHKRFDKVFEKEGGKILSIHRDTMELCIIKNERSTIWEKLCLLCSPISVSFFICIISTKEFNGDTPYWKGFITALTCLFGIIGIICGIAWYYISKAKKPIVSAILENSIGFTNILKESDSVSNSESEAAMKQSSISNTL